MAQSSSYAKNPRLMRFAKFEVNEGKHDKKLCEDTTDALEALVTKCSNKLQLPAVAVANCDKEILGVKVMAPEGPLKEIFEDPYVKEKLLVAMQKEALVLSEKIFKLNQGQDVAGNIVGQNVVSPLLKSPEPIFSLIASKMEKYFPNFLASLALADGVKLRYKLPSYPNSILG